MSRKYKFLLFPLVVVFITCTEKEVKNDYIISKDKFIQVIADFHFVDAASKQMVIQSNRNVYIKHQQFKGILEKHNIPRDQFDSTVTYYSQKPEEFKAIYEKVEILLVQGMENKKH